MDRRDTFTLMQEQKKRHANFAPGNPGAWLVHGHGFGWKELNVCALRRLQGPSNLVS